MNLLSSFCKSYLNIAPEVCEFHPYLPYVLLVVLDYGRMAIEQTNMGWVSQHEVFFAVPLGRWYRRRPRDRAEFRGWVVNTPFIFVDNPTSVTSGREVYGWPKVLCRLNPTLEQWLTDPRRPNRLLTLDIASSHDAEGQRLLEIEHRLDQNPSIVPPDLDVNNPFDRLSRFSRGAWSGAWDLAQLLMRAPLAGFGPKNPWGRGEVLFDSLRNLLGFYRKPRVDVVTLKQFRDAGDPTQICYQSLVKSRLGVARYNRGGALGLYNLLQGDITGGFHIRLHDHPSLPIVSSLGLEVARERTVDGRTVSVLEPAFPFWLSIDLTYGLGETICWRSRDSLWFRKGSPVPPRDSKPGARGYNTVAGAAQQVWCGPFLVPEAHCDVFPLPAHRKTLRRFIKRYLNLDKDFHYEPWGEHVYMVASSGRMLSWERSGEWIESCQVAFHVPLLQFDRQRRLTGIAVAKPFAFVDDPLMAMTQREVQGVPSVYASILTPSHSWLCDGPLLTMEVDVFPALDAGLPSERRPLLEVKWGSEGAAPPFEPPCPSDSSVPAEELRDRLLGMACELVRGDRRLQVLTLKQFRDAEDPQRACYQALVLEPWKLNLLNGMKKLDTEKNETKMEVLVYQYPSLPLVETLGLCSGPVRIPEERKGAIAHVLKPECPFRVDLSLEIHLAEAMSHAVGFLPWEPRKPQRGKITLPWEPSPDRQEKKKQELPDEADLRKISPQMIISDLLTRGCDPCPKANGRPPEESAEGEGEATAVGTP